MEDHYERVCRRLSASRGRVWAGLYIHYPFCRQKCSYCHFVSSVHDPELHRRWLSGIKAEIRRAAVLFSEYLAVDTVYFGGGTPSLMKPDEVRELLSSVHQNFEAEFQEVTLEVNPPTEPGMIKGWLEAGITRLSLGAQSFDPAVLGTLGRGYSPGQVIETLEEARAAGAENIGLDLMAGIPGETFRTLEVNLQALVELRPRHVSVYLLEELENVPFRKVWEKAPVPEDLAAETYEKYRLGLEEAGWLQYEISNFSQPGYRCRHNLKYWEYQPFLGLGPSASSHLGNFRWTNPERLADWLAALKPGKQSFSEFVELKPDEEVRECLASGLRLIEGVSLSGLVGRYPGFDFSTYQKKIKQLAEAGLVQVREGRVRISPDKFLTSNYIISELLY